MIYLDHAATTPVAPEAAAAVYDALTGNWGNPSAQYPLGHKAKALTDDCRRRIAEALGCAPERLVFTSCGTESDNQAIRLAVAQNRRVGRHIITTAVEHSAVLEPIRQLQAEGFAVTFLPPDRDGNITAEQVGEALREDTALVSVMLVNNETGCVFPVSEIAALLRARNSRALLHTDAVQGFLKVPFRADALGADLISLSGHKIGGPKGVGALYLGPRINLQQARNHALLAGGGQENGYRSGTEATAQLAGFARAAELRSRTLDRDLAHMAALKAYALDKLLGIGGVERIGKGTAPHILSVSLVGYPSANVVEDLGSRGICVSAGSACHRGRASHVYEAMGLAKRVKGGALRLSFGPENTEEDVDALVEALRQHKETRFPVLGQ